MISQLFIQMVKYAFGFLVVAMVSDIPAKSRMAVKHVKLSKGSINNDRRKKNSLLENNKGIF